MDTDRNLLFGVLALQADLITADQFVRACTLWTTCKDKALADLLIEHGWLTPADRTAVDHLLQRKLNKHQGDARASLAEVATNPVQRLLGVLNDPDLQRSLEQLSHADGHILLTTTTALPETRERYTLTRLHASGGIGRVWLARDSSLGRDVALKELLPERMDSPALWHRFLKEAQITGQLEHPAIVPVYELARRSEQQPPFYTMRFVKGRTLTEAIQAYHHKRQAGKAGPLDLSELLTAFVGVCQAVAYAHARGVIHRDLKGQNVVLGDYGEVVLLDWGLAKLIDHPDEDMAASSPVLNVEMPSEATVQGQVLGTPAYMAPEQAEGRLEQIDQRTDVYGLGAILYEILTGRPPFTGTNTKEVLRKVCTEEPLRPQAICTGVPAALEAVCLRALAKNRTARYARAAEVAQEVQRWLAGEPVMAYREPLSVRGQRWMRQHRTLVTGAAAALVVALIGLAGGLVVVTGLNRQLDVANADLAEKGNQLDARNTELAAANANERQARQRAEKVLEYFVATFRRADPSQDGEKVTIAHVLKRSARELPSEASLEPSTRAALLNAIGRTYLGLGLYAEALGVMEWEHALRQQHQGPDHPDTLESMNNLAVVYQAAGRLTDALTLHEQTLKRKMATLGPDHHDTLESMSNLAVAYQSAGRLVDALPLHEEVLKRMKENFGPDHPDTLKSMNNLALAYEAAGRLADALPLHEETRKLGTAKLGPDHPDTLQWMNNLALAYQSAGRLADAMPLFEETLKLRKAKLGPDHPDTLVAMNNLARAYQSVGRLVDALPLHEETLKLMKAKLGPEHPNTMIAMNNLAAAYYSAGRLADALPLFEERLKLQKTKLGPDHPDTLMAMNNLAMAYQSVGRLAQALPLLEETLKRRQTKLGTDHPSTLISMKNLAAAYRSAGRLTDALPLQEETLKRMKAKLGADHPITLAAMNDLAAAYRSAGRLTDALPLLQEVLDKRRKQSAPLDLANTLAALGWVLTNLDRAADAEPLLRECLALREKHLPVKHWLVAQTRSLLGGCLAKQQKFADAERCLLHGYQGLSEAKDAPRQHLEEALEQLAQLYTAWGQNTKADEWRKRLEEAKKPPAKLPQKGG